MFGNTLYIIGAISVSKGKQSFYVGSLDLLFPSASNTQTSNYCQHNLRTVCECVIFLFTTKKRIRNSLVTSIMISLKDRIPEYGRAFHSTFSKQTRIRYQGLNRHQSNVVCLPLNIDRRLILFVLILALFLFRTFWGCCL